MSEPTFDGRPAEPPIGVQHRTVHDAEVIMVTGGVDMVTGPALREAITGSLGRSPGGLLVVDLTAVTFFGSTGLAVLVEADAAARQGGGRMRVVVDDNAAVRRPIEITGLDQVLAVYSAMEMALGAA